MNIEVREAVPEDAECAAYHGGKTQAVPCQPDQECLPRQQWFLPMLVHALFLLLGGLLRAPALSLHGVTP